MYGCITEQGTTTVVLVDSQIFILQASSARFQLFLLTFTLQGQVLHLNYDVLHILNCATLHVAWSRGIT